jgi:hypothetical protein
VIIHGASGVKGARDLHGKALVLIFTLVIRVDGQDRELNYVQITTHCMCLWGMTDRPNELPRSGNRNDTYIAELFTPIYAMRSILSVTFDFDLLIIPMHLIYEEHQRPPNSLFPCTQNTWITQTPCYERENSRT